MNRPVVFLQPWLGRKVGETTADVEHGVASVLVKRNIARWADLKTESKGRSKR